jgi:hypothetical protein
VAANRNQKEAVLLDLLVEVTKYSVLALLTLIAIYILMRVGTLAVLQSMDQFARRR